MHWMKTLYPTSSPLNRRGHMPMPNLRRFCWTNCAHFLKSNWHNLTCNGSSGLAPLSISYAARSGSWPALLGLAVLLITGNTIRLEIQNRRDEIEITKLIGATNGFIRRPFLYSGFWYGVMGAVVAGLLVELAFLQLHSPVRQLAGLYQSGFSLQTLSLTESLALLVAGTSLGLLGAWLAVGRHLAAIEPA